MKKYNKSLKRIKQQKINDICAKMRAAKERKRVENATPAEDVKQNRHAFSFFIIDHRIGESISLECYESDRINSYWVREDGKGWWTEKASKTRILDVLRHRLPSTRRYD